jgi:hypothetical protein
VSGCVNKSYKEHETKFSIFQKACNIARRRALQLISKVSEDDKRVMSAIEQLSTPSCCHPLGVYP